MQRVMPDAQALTTTINRPDAGLHGFAPILTEHSHLYASLLMKL